ncbi:TetR/AcrR family transcriptional regulator [Planococcus sp. CAU13]|uniref:TetR/AcrR family transcriptional regulator n=1 Tax=Planococcus sp. CAU13 TaxID=1541197 RepID=UPI00052FEDD7|nr:TetR/AcrR family transcriptional regulator [Planococcus sp. CAU13]
MDKKQELMNAAVHLFSIKGFHQTSVQEIANAVDISKGAFYKHYDSKESLLVGILKRYQAETLHGLNRLEISAGLTPKEAFAKKLAFELESILADRDFFIMVFKDMPTEDNEQLTSLMQDMRSSSSKFHKDMLLEAFGVEIEPFLEDMTIVVEGVLKEYMITIILENRQLSIDKLSRFIASSVEAIVLQLPSMEAVITEKDEDDFSLDSLFADIETKIKLYSKNTAQLLSSLDLLRQELQQDEPRDFLIEVLANYLMQEKQIEKEVLLLKNHH